jgi:hypothetical protein
MIVVYKTLCSKSTSQKVIEQIKYLFTAKLGWVLFVDRKKDGGFEQS